MFNLSILTHYYGYIKLFILNKEKYYYSIIPYFSGFIKKEIYNFFIFSQKNKKPLKIVYYAHI